MPRRLRRSLLPLSLTIAGVWMLVGCVWIPVFEKPIDGDTDYSNPVGNRGSKRPIRLKVSSREDVLRVLGPPRFTTPDQSQFAYSWRVLNGYYVWPLCFPLSLPQGEAPVYAQQGSRTLILTFDERGNLNGSRVTGYNGNWWSGYAGYPSAPPGMVPYHATTRTDSAAPGSSPSPPRASPSNGSNR